MSVTVDEFEETSSKSRITLGKAEALALAEELFAMVRRLGALGFHAEAQAIQERANPLWIRGLGREVRA